MNSHAFFSSFVFSYRSNSLSFTKKMLIVHIFFSFLRGVCYSVMSLLYIHLHFSFSFSHLLIHSFVFRYLVYMCTYLLPSGRRHCFVLFSNRINVWDTFSCSIIGRYIPTHNTKDFKNVSNIFEVF